jgi:hypothetical protein
MKLKVIHQIGKLSARATHVLGYYYVDPFLNMESSTDQPLMLGVLPSSLFDHLTTVGALM